MKIFLTKQAIDEIQTDTIILTFFSDERPLKGESGLLDWRMNSYISKQLEEKKIKGNLHENTLILGNQKIQSKKIYLFGMGETNSFNEDKIDKIVGHIKETLKGMNVDNFSFVLSRNISDRKTYKRFLKHFFNSFSVILKDKVNSIYFHYEHDEEKEALYPLKSNHIKLFEEKAGNL